MLKHHTFVSFFIAYAILGHCCTQTMAVGYSENHGVWKIDLSHDEAKNSATIAAAVGSHVPQPYALIAIGVSALIEMVDELGGEKGVSITGVGATGSYFVTPRGSIPVYEQAIALQTGIQDVAIHWAAVCTTLGNQVTQVLTGTDFQNMRTQPHYDHAHAILLTQLAYNQILERSADAGGLKVYVHALENGFKVRAVIESMVISDEYERKFVVNRSLNEIDQGLFRHLLAREIPPPLPNDWNVNHIRTLGWRTTAKMFVHCPEYNERFGDDRVPYRK